MSYREAEVRAAMLACGVMSVRDWTRYASRPREGGVLLKPGELVSLAPGERVDRAEASEAASGPKHITETGDDD